nr:uncharacterized protein PFB0145c-like isoform X2 [Megalopta genalis]
MCFNDVTCNIDKEEEISKDNTKLIEKEEHRSNGVYKKLNKKIDTKTLECKKELNCLKQDSTSMTVQGVCELPTNTNANLKQSDTTVTVGYLKVQEESVDEIKNSESLKMQSLFNGKTNQLKDSGIDEDSEEEFQDNGKDVYARKQRKVQDICENTNLTSPAANFKSVSTVETTLSNTDNLASDIHDISDTTASQCTALVTPKTSNNKEEEENKVERIKLQPKVTGTKIIKKKYRIISDSILSLNTFFESKADDSPVSNKVMDPIYTEHNAEDSTSPVFKRRSQQMKRFNLTVDSESSLSDDDNEYCNTENMRDKLFKRAKESSDLSDSQDGNMGFKHRLSLQNSNRFKKHKNYAFKNSSKGKNIYLREKHINNEESVQLIRSVEVNSNKCKNALDCSGKKKTSSQNSFKQSVHYSNNESDTSEENKKLEKLFVKNDKTERTNKNDETTTQSTFKNSIMQTRPKNLQELMEKENLIYETALPSVTLKDLQENNVFLLEIPSVVLETELLEQKFVLTKKKLKLGEHKYRIAFNDTDQMFGVLNTGKSHTNYKAVNMKSMKRFVAYQKVVRTASEKSSNKCTNIEIDDDTEIPI